MERSPTEITTARRNLAQRIERFVGKVGATPDELTSDHLANLSIALTALEHGDYPAGEDAMMLAEYGLSPRRTPTAADIRPLAEMVADFERLRAG
jgi:hypothetical protein